MFRVLLIAIFALIAVVNLVFFAIASQASWESAKYQSSLILLYFPIFLCWVIHNNYTGQGDNKNIIANVSIILAFIYPLFFHTIFMVQIVYGGMDVPSDPGGFGQVLVVIFLLITLLTIANSVLMINIGFLLNKFSGGSFILVIAIILFNASAIGIFYL